MNRGGVGSASIVLVFAVLCITIFTIISFVPALNEDKLITSELALVTSFYNADVVAEKIVAEILANTSTPAQSHGIDIEAEFDFNLMAEIISFNSPITDSTMIHVIISRFEQHDEITSWRVVNTAQWQADERLNVWLGPEDDTISTNTDTSQNTEAESEEHYEIIEDDEEVFQTW